MDAVGLGYLRDDNCFPWIKDWLTAQQLMDQQLTVKWPAWSISTAPRSVPTSLSVGVAEH